MEIYDLLNYADDNTLSIIRNTLNLVIGALKKDAENAMLWFTEKVMQANATTFQFMIMQKYTSKQIIPDSIEIHGTTIMRQTEVKLLSLTIDQKLKFDKHIDNLCKLAASQIYIMFRFKGIFDLKESKIIYNTFILAHFNYCPMVWHFCGKASTKKIELIQERALRFLLMIKRAHIMKY